VPSFALICTWEDILKETSVMVKEKLYLVLQHFPSVVACFAVDLVSLRAYYLNVM